LRAEATDHPHVFLSLLPEPGGSRAAEALRRALQPGTVATVLVTPVQGIDFFAARGDLAAELDDWWQRHVPTNGRPVILVRHEPGLERHLAGLDCELIVGVAGEADRHRYASLRQAVAIVTDDPLTLAEHAIASFDCFGAPAAPPAPATPPGEGVLFMPRLESHRPARTLPPVATAAPAPRLLDPFTALSTVEALPPEQGLAVRTDDDLVRASLFQPRRRRRAGAGHGWFGLARLFGRGRAIAIPREIGDLVLGLHPAPVVVVPGRKGGVGKTVTAGAVAQVIGYALGDTTGSAAIVDQNIGNPDQWGRLDIPGNAGTVRQLMAALSSGYELPPTPAWAKTPALAVYPEDRTSVDAYPPGLIQRFVHHLRERHVFIVVDLPNRLPDFSSAEASICAAYIDLADLVILPTTDDPTALLSAMEYLDIPSMRGKPVVVSHIESNDRKLRRHPVVTELLAEIRNRVVAVVTVPRSEKATLAIVEGTSILDISGQLRDAYVRVASAAVRALATGA
jgi:MinD-like ATPase involved in chromosome partitioning or flagellar assembly